MVIGRRTAPRGYGSPHPQAREGGPRRQGQAAPAAASSCAVSGRLAQAGDERGACAPASASADAGAAKLASSGQPSRVAVRPDGTSSPGQGRPPHGRARSRREGPSIPRGADRTQQAPRVAGARPAAGESPRRMPEGQGPRAAREHAEGAGSAASRRGGAQGASPKSRTEASARPAAAPADSRDSSEEARRAAERAARQRRMAERRKHTAMAQPRPAEAAPRGVRASAAHAAPSCEEERRQGRPAGPETAASSDTPRKVAPQTRSERPGASAHARHAR